MKLKIAWIGKTKAPAIQSLTDEYLKRLKHYAEVEGELRSTEFDSEVDDGKKKSTVRG